MADIPPFYATGTATFTAGSNVVNFGGGADLVAWGVQPYYTIRNAVGQTCTVLEVVTATQLKLTRNFAGTAQVNGAYEIWPTPKPIELGGIGRNVMQLAGKPNILGLSGIDGTGGNWLPWLTGAGTWDKTALTAFARSLLDDPNAATMLATLGVSTFARSILDDADAAAALTTLGVSAFVRTLLDDASAAAARATLGAAEDHTSGLWTPTVTGFTTNPTLTYTVQQGWYYKVGKLILAFFRVDGNVSAVGSGALQISGLPFAGGGYFGGNLAISTMTTQDCKIDLSGATSIIRFLTLAGSTYSAANLSTGATRLLAGSITYQTA